MLPPGTHCKNGWTGLTVPTLDAEHCFDASRRITAPIAAVIALQESDLESASIEVKTIKSKVRTEKHNNQLAEAAAILNKLSPPQQRLQKCARERCLLAVIHPTHRRTWLHAAQRCLQTCPMSQVQLVGPKSTTPLCVRRDTLTIDHIMCVATRGFPHFVPQQDP